MSRFPQRLWLFVALRETRMTPRKLAFAMEREVGRPVDPALIDRVLDGQGRFTDRMLRAAASVTGVDLRPNLEAA